MKISFPRALLHVEGAVVFIAACYIYSTMNQGWLPFLALFLVPDLSMLGYAAGNRVGSVLYNAMHTYVGPIGFFAMLQISRTDDLSWIAVVWTAHIAMDRMLGYGLKYPTAFKDTHIGRA